MNDGLVRVDDPEHMNLLGLLMASFLKAKLSDPRLRRRATRMRGNYGLTVGTMSVTLCFEKDGLWIRKGVMPRTRGRISAPMQELVALATGNGGLAAATIAVLEWRISIRGNPFAILSLLPIMLGKNQTASAATSEGVAQS